MPDMPASIQIRLAVLADIPALADVHIRSWQWAYRGQLPAEYLDRLSESLDQRIAARRRELANLPHDARWWVVEQDGQLVGFAMTEPSRDSDTLPLTSEVRAIYLAHEAPGKGIGRTLFAHAVTDLRQRGYRHAILWVLESNTRARRFYEAAGFAPDGVRKNEERPGAPLHEVRYAIT